MTKKRLIALLAAAAMLASSSAALAAEKDAPETAAAVVTEAVTAEEEAVPQAQEIPEAQAELADDAYESPVSNAVSAVYDDETIGEGPSINGLISALGSSSVSVMLNDNVTENVVIPEGKTVTIDLNGHTITNSDDEFDKAGYSGNDVLKGTILNKGTLIIKGTGSIINNRNADGAVIANAPGANVQLEGGTYKGTGDKPWYTIKNLGTMTIEKDVKVEKNGTTAASLVVNGYDTVSNKEEKYEVPKLIINGGNFEATGNTLNAIKNDGLGSVLISDGTFSCSNSSGADMITWGEASISGGIFEDRITIGRYDDNGTIVQGDLNISGGIFDSIAYVEKYPGGTITITGGTFSKDIGAYTPDGYYQKKITDDKYEVLETKATFTSTAQSPFGYAVTLDGLKNNSSIIDHSDGTSYSVEVSDFDTNVPISTASSDYGKTEMMDITVYQTKDGQKNKFDLKEQPVTIELASKADTNKVVKVYHFNNSNWDLVNDAKLIEDGSKVQFVAPSFSGYAVAYNPAAVQEYSKNIGVAFVKNTEDVYDIYLKSQDGKTINRYMTADLTFSLEGSELGTLTYTVNPATDINLVNKEGSRYEFNLDGKKESGISGKTIKIGEIVFNGYGKGTFKVDDTANANDTNAVHTAKATDNIVDEFLPNGNQTTTGKLSLNNEVTTDEGEGTIKDYERKPETKDLTINVVFPNNINNQSYLYQDMKVTVSGGDLADSINVPLGDVGAAVITPEWNDTTNSYSVEVKDKLTKNTAYTVTVEGAGYRTARYTVNMTENKTLNFWNNVKDVAEVIEVGSDKPAVTKNFLAGDIVADNTINIYDLSAVVSYFGTDNCVTDHPEYAKYDLNRDGKIDSKDIAYVLVSWGE